MSQERPTEIPMAGVESSLFDALVSAVAEDPACNRSEFEEATDTLARLWRQGSTDEIPGALFHLDRIDAEDYEEWAQPTDEHDGDPPDLPETPEHRMERLREWYLAPADVAACAVLAWYIESGRGGSV